MTMTKNSDESNSTPKNEDAGETVDWVKVKRLASIPMVILCLAILADVAVIVFVEYGRQSADFVGCFAWDAMLVGFECRGFPGSGLATVLLNWPLWMIYGPLFTFAHPAGILMTLVAWGPVAYYFKAVWEVAKQRRRNASKE